jgi:acyl-CoA reductase-like NAD-dependent aldehyde dehydrogenase
MATDLVQRAPLTNDELGMRREISSCDPRSGVTWRTWPHPSDDAVHAAVRAARLAQPEWAATPLTRRIEVIRRFRTACFQNRHELAALIERETGKSQADALAADVIVTLDLAAYFARVSAKLLRSRVETGASLAMIRKVVEIRRDPVGVIAVISPWNYPLMLAAGVVIPALLAGNAVILKPSEFSTATAERLIELLVASGVPASVCQCLPGDAETGAALIGAGVNKVFFTGSLRGGRAVAEACGRQMIPANLELGGNDAAVVLADADMPAAARGLLWGRFFTAGQSCVAPKRIFVEAVGHDALVSALTAEMAILELGGANGGHIGPLIRPAQVETLTEQRDDALMRGAKVAATVRRAAGTDAGAYAIPTLLTNVSADARIMREEAFGPLMSVISVPSVDAAIALANDSEFGLSASVWTRDAARASLIAGQLQAGTVLVNDVLVNVGIPNLPHGGVKSSGTGRSHGAEGLLECTQVRTIVRDRINWMPQPWWFARTVGSTAFLDAVARAAHAPSLLDRLRGIVLMVRGWPRR